MRLEPFTSCVLHSLQTAHSVSVTPQVNSQEADAVGTSDDSRSNPTAQDRQPATRKDMHAPADGGKPEEGLGTRLSLLVQVSQ